MTEQRHRKISSRSRAHARAMRRHATEAEEKLWSLLRNRRLEDWKFRRQLPIGGYIVDFVCLSSKLVIEADGSQHGDNPRDQRRDAWLGHEGFRIQRFWNHEIIEHDEMVIDTILARLGESPTA